VLQVWEEPQSRMLIQTPIAAAKQVNTPSEILVHDGNHAAEQESQTDILSKASSLVVVAGLRPHFSHSPALRRLLFATEPMRAITATPMESQSRGVRSTSPDCPASPRDSGRPTPA